MLWPFGHERQSLLKDSDDPSEHLGGQNVPLVEVIRGPAFQLPICPTGGWGECGLIQKRMWLIAPGCCLATTLQQPVCTFGMVEGAIEGLKTHPYQPLWGALAVLTENASWQGKTCSWPFNHEGHSLLCTGKQGENL